jgi:lipopolysaccharide biosynthesis glycosyltransferase
MLPSLAPNIDKNLYLDSDTIATRDLGALWNIDISDYYMAGACDISARFRELGFETFVNAGVLLMNLEKMRKDNIEEKLFRFMAEHGDLINDAVQDLINYVMRGKIKLIPDIFNYLYCIPLSKTTLVKPEYIRRPPENITILHFAGKKKPWNSYEILEKYSKQYFDNFRLTPWGREYKDPPLAVRYIRRAKAFIIRHFKYAVLTVADMTGTEKYLRKVQSFLKT